jgi:uncharacterized protein (TIGR02246 family)
MNSNFYSEAVPVIDALVDAYNAHDANAFAELFAEDANAYEHPSVLAQKGREGIRAFYTERFAATPEITTEVRYRIVFGDFVIDHEHVRRAKNEEPFQVVAIYLVQGGQIQRVELVR